LVSSRADSLIGVRVSTDLAAVSKDLHIDFSKPDLLVF
jgi:hypothetical protein